MNECFAYRRGELHAEDVPLRRIAEAVGTPCYVYSAAALSDRYRRFAAAFGRNPPLICYAVKANSNLAVLRLLAQLGAGADVVSEGELRRALTAGIPPERIVFSGVGKTAGEIATALANGVHQINVESLSELHCVAAVANQLRRTAPVALRVNPDVDALTHAKIATGKRENKFGIDADDAIAVYRTATDLPGIRPVGLALHIGSQIVDLAPYRLAFEKLAGLVRALRECGLGVERIDLGGGLGIRYDREQPPAFADYARLARDVFAGFGVALEIEPGRALVGPAGVLIARVVYLKEGASRRFVVVDAAMNDLIRPALYDAWHDIVPVTEASPRATRRRADVVGPICETGDTFAAGRALPELAEGDLLAFTEAGAYGAVMSSSYNSRLLVPEVLVCGDRYDIVRARPSYDALLALDTIPAWLAAQPAEPRQTRGRE